MNKTFTEEQKAWNNLMKLINNSGLIDTNYELYEEIAYELDVIMKFLFKEEN